MIAFPKDFLWGAALSAHPSEGGNFANDWWRWEQRPGRILDGSGSTAAADHFHRFEADFDLAQKLGHRAHLFVIEWSRVQPEEGRFDNDAIRHYAAVMDALSNRGIEPLCALNHAALPLWFAERYGWHHPDAPALFEAYAQHTASVLGDRCRRWLTMQEPMYTVTMGYLEGLWPPGLSNPIKAVAAIQNLAKAHAKVYRVLHATRPDVQVGLAVQGRLFKPKNADSAWDLRTARREHQRCNHLFLEAVVSGRYPFPLREDPVRGGTLDFIGLAYYGTETVRFHPARPGNLFVGHPRGRMSSLLPSQREPHPEGLYQLVHELSRYGLPLLVTGNGLATTNDTARCKYILDHLAVLHRCLKEGLDVRGYLYRSLLSGFEWTEGYGSDFGLVHVDRGTLARTPNGSAYLLKDIYDTRMIRLGAVARFCPGWTGPPNCSTHKGCATTVTMSEET